MVYNDIVPKLEKIGVFFFFFCFSSLLSTFRHLILIIYRFYLLETLISDHSHQRLQSHIIVSSKISIFMMNLNHIHILSHSDSLVQ